MEAAWNHLQMCFWFLCSELFKHHSKMMVPIIPLLFVLLFWRLVRKVDEYILLVLWRHRKAGKRAMT